MKTSQQFANDHKLVSAGQLGMTTAQLRDLARKGLVIECAIGQRYFYDADDVIAVRAKQEPAAPRLVHVDPVVVVQDQNGAWLPDLCKSFGLNRNTGGRLVNSCKITATLKTKAGRPTWWVSSEHVQAATACLRQYANRDTQPALSPQQQPAIYPAPAPQGRCISAVALAEEIGAPLTTVNSWCSKGWVVAFKNGHRWFVYPDEQKSAAWVADYRARREQMTHLRTPQPAEDLD